MIGDVTCSLNAMLFGLVTYEGVSEMSTVGRLSSFWGTMSPSDLLFKAQEDSVLCSRMGHMMFPSI